MTAPLDKKLERVKWGEFKLGDLFEIDSVSSFNADVLVPGNEYDYITRTSFNQGIFKETGFINSENLNPSGVWSLGLLQMDFFYRKKSWYAGQFMRKITPKIEIPQGAVLYISTILNKQKPALSSALVRNVDSAFRSVTVQLPVLLSGEIDFNFMESFIAELEAERIAELEAYLKVSGLDNYELSAEEEAALENYNALVWREYQMGTLFEKIKTKKLPYKADDLPSIIDGSYTLPCLTSSFKNQGLNYFAPKEGATVLKDVISIPSNSDVYRAYYQSNEFTVLSDAYAIRWIFADFPLSPLQYLFTVACINKVTDLPIYSYKEKLGGWNVVKDKFILLPVKDGKPDYQAMEILISAVRKLVIKDVVRYADAKIKAAREVVTRRRLSDGGERVK